MSIIGGTPAYKILKLIGVRDPSSSSSDSYYANFEETSEKLEQFFGKDLSDRIKDKTVIDFGCGSGYDTIQLAKMGASKVIGLDIRERVLSIGREEAEKSTVADRCTFVTKTDELADIIISKDAFEHFEDPEKILDLMTDLLKPDGQIEISFGPTWLHPLGGHLFSVFPWAHLIFSEKALIRWRADFKSDGATKFSEIEGGLNQITIKQFEKIVEESSCRIEMLETVPIKGISLFKSRLFREFGSSIVRCKLVKKESTESKT